MERGRAAFKVYATQEFVMGNRAHFTCKEISIVHEFVLMTNYRLYIIEVAVPGSRTQEDENIINYESFMSYLAIMTHH